MMLKREECSNTLYSAPLSCDVTQQSDQAMSDAFLADTADHSPQEEAWGGDTALWATLGNQPDRNLRRPNKLFLSLNGQVKCCIDF